MKLPGSHIESFLRRPDDRYPVILVYGPDEGLVRERVERLIASVLEDAADPFRSCDLNADLVQAEPGRLLDEARALSLIGGRRVVRLRQAGDQVTAACKALLALPAIEALVLIEAGELTRSSSLRRLIERAPNAVALPCYRDEGRSLAALIDRLLAERGLQAEADARDYLIEHLGSDRGITRSELDKLALYVADDRYGSERTRRRVSLDDVAAVIGDSATLSIDDLVHAAALGDQAATERCLNRLLAQGESPIRLIRALANHMTRLHRFACQIERGESPERVVAAARPQVHFRRRNDVVRQLRHWRTERTERVLARLIEAEIGCKTTGRPAGTLCRRAAYTICAMARPH